MGRSFRTPCLAATVALTVALAVGAGACTSDGPSRPLPPPSTDPTIPVPTVASSTTTTTAAPDITVVPAVIDAPYVAAVLAALLHLQGDAFRAAKATGTLPPAAVDGVFAGFSSSLATPS